ncbi:MAG: phage tail protein [Lachnospiraceae bacterium]|jgi:HK97 gp10 family phage protein|nr:phage tail protein [Lachnospiraceae bacterium]
MAKLKIEGLGELQKGLRKKASLDLVKQTVKLNTMEMKDKIHDNAVFTRGYSTGDTQRSVSYSIEDSGFTGVAGAKMHYDEYVEKGTRFMDAQPFIRPAYEEQAKKFKSDMRKLVR